MIDADKRIVISLGGSIIFSDGVDVNFLKDFVTTIKEYVAMGFKFSIITGGGIICRQYNNSLKEIVIPSFEDLDWLGIAVTRLNAEFIRICFEDLAYEKVILDPDNIPDTDKPILVGGGWRPGNSSDLAAVHSAKSIEAKKVVNLSNIDFVYNTDPKNNPDAFIIKEINWSEFRKLLPEKWRPGLSSPFDPIAAKEAESFGLEVVIMNGRNIENLKDYLDGKDFIGTIIK